MEFIGEIIVALGAITAAIIQTYRINSLKKNSVYNLSEKTDEIIEQKVRVFDSIDGKYNQKFYDYFIEKIKNAKRDIYITGDGFDFSSLEGKLIANNFVDAFNYALRTNPELKVVRVQTKAETHPEWAQMLSESIKEFGDRFEFFVLPKGKTTQISSVCAIDPCLKKDNVSEIMLSTQTLRGTESSDIAGTAIFIEGKEHLAQNLQTRILTLTKSSRKFTSGENIIESLVGDQYYFAYGSNMEFEQMKERIPSAVQVAIGSLDNHRLVFNREGTYRLGGVASVEESNKDRVYGVIWKIDIEGLLRLDHIEDPNAYHRKTFTINTLGGRTFSCHVYLSYPQGELEPDPQYLNKIINAAITAELPSKYIDNLKSLKNDF